VTTYFWPEKKIFLLSWLSFCIYLLKNVFLRSLLGLKVAGPEERAVSIVAVGTTRLSDRTVEITPGRLNQMVLARYTWESWDWEVRCL
jgi:hypothetical protein